MPPNGNLDRKYLMSPDSMSMLDRTLELVRNRPRTMTYDTIANDTGLSKPWLEAFAAGRIPDPGVRKVETLFAYLSN